MTDAAIDILQRWHEFGGTWRVRSLDELGAVVDLCSCEGQPVDVLRSTDVGLLQYLADRPGSDAG